LLLGRNVTFFYPDEAAVTARFVQRGYTAPAFRAGRWNKRVAMVLDPANQWVELVIAPGASADAIPISPRDHDGQRVVIRKGTAGEHTNRRHSVRGLGWGIR
jgi:hypothetical protein